MKIGFVGLGKLGLPVAVAINSKGHDVIGYDVNKEVKSYLDDRSIPFKEEGLQPLLDKHTVKWSDDVRGVVENSDVIFVPIQTPHDPEFEGSTRIPDERQDFNYNFLVSGIAEIAHTALELKKNIHIVVISTCLPNTYNERIAPIILNNPYVRYVYNPFFIAMGTVLKDFLNPEFVLLGGDGDLSTIKDFYRTIHDRPFMETDLTTAEGIKVFYNTFITMKTVLANTYGEMAHKIGMNVDDIYKALSMATDRIVSPKYLKAGMGDGGGCHPRDNIALSYLARKINLSHNIFEDLMEAREDHAEWLARLAMDESRNHDLPLVVLGRAFKPETNIETGSPALLVSSIISKEYGYPVQHVEDLGELEKAVYLIATEHDKYRDYKFPEGSIIIDPFGSYRQLSTGGKVIYIPIGRPATIKDIRA